MADDHEAITRSAKSVEDLASQRARTNRADTVDQGIIRRRQTKRSVVSEIAHAQRVRWGARDNPVGLTPLRPKGFDEYFGVPAAADNDDLSISHDRFVLFYNRRPWRGTLLCARSQARGPVAGVASRRMHDGRTYRART